MAGMPIGTPNFQVPDASVDDPVFRPRCRWRCISAGLRPSANSPRRQSRDPVPQLRLHNLALARAARALRRLCQRRCQPLRHRAGLPGRRARQQRRIAARLLRRARHAGARCRSAVDIAKRATEEGRSKPSATSLPMPSVTASWQTRRGERRDRQQHDRQCRQSRSAGDQGPRRARAGRIASSSKPQYGVDVTEKNLLDTVYHEHLSYFNIKPLTHFFKRFGMDVIDVQHTREQRADR